MLFLGEESLASSETRTFIIFGSPRGGTSMVAKLVREMGVNIGEDLPVNLEDPNFNWDFLEAQDNDEKIASIKKSVNANNDLKKIWGWKYPRSTLYLDNIWNNIVNPHLICIFRDPLLISFRNIARRSKEPYQTIKNAINLQQKNINFLQKHQEVPQFLCSYEKVLQDPSSFVQSLAKYLSFEFTNQRNIEYFSKLINPVDGYNANKLPSSREK